MADLKARGFNCRNCGAAIELRGLLHTRTVACTSCAAVQDPDDPNLLVLQEAQRRTTHPPRIPLGTRGTLRGRLYEVIGFQRREIVVEGDTYGWGEYLLFNPYHGFRYLSEYEGHWNVIRTLQALPEMVRAGRHASARHGGNTYKHFQTANAATVFVLGEFPWRIRVGDRAQVSDYVSPPRMLSAEHVETETTWSIGEYADGSEIWRAFSLPGDPPQPVGVFANQPSPHAGRVGRMWRAFLVLALLATGVLAWRYLTAANEPVYERPFVFRPVAGESAFVTEFFDVPEGPSTVAVEIRTDLSNNWAYFTVALVEAERGTALEFGREISYYAGRDSDGAWSEGSRDETVRLPQVPAGRYYLRIEPEGPGNSRVPVTYTVRVRRDVPSALPFLIALGVLVVPPLLVTWRAASFEQRRWAESGDSGGDDEDDD
jgi:hypothetical protein